MKKLVVTLAALITAAAFTGVAFAADPTADLLKKEGAAVDTVQKKDQELKDKKKKVADKVKAAKDAPDNAVKDAKAKKAEKIKKGKEAVDKAKGDAGQVKDQSKKNLDDLKAIGK